MATSHHVTRYPIYTFYICFIIENWLTNSSFQVVNAPAAAAPTVTVQSDDEAVQAIDSDDEVDDSTWTQKRPSSPTKKRSKKKKKKRRKGKRSKSDDNDEEESNIEFTGQEDYYVDKKPCYRDFATGTMDKRDVARYHINVRLLGTLTHQQWQMMYRSKKEKSKRYFVGNIGNDSGDEAGNSGVGASASSSNKDNNKSNSTTKTYRLTEDEFIAKTKIFTKRLADDANDIDAWLEYVRFQENFYMKMTKVQLAERKMEILHRALHDNSSNERLYREYVSILESAYPSFEVSKFLDNLIQKGNQI